MAKYDTSTTYSDLTKDSLRALVKTYRIPLDLHPRLANPGLSMDCLLSDAIGIYTQFLRFSGLCAYLTRLREVNESVLVWSGLSSAWFNQKCDLVFRRKGDKFEIISTSVGPSEDVQPKRKRRLRRKASKAGFSAPAMEQAEDVDDVDLSDTDYCAFLEVAFFDPSHVGTSNATNASSFDHADVRKGAVAIGAASKAQAEVIRQQLDPMDVLDRNTLACDHEYDQIPNVDFSIATLNEEIDLTLFPLAPRPYYMSYLFVNGEGIDPPKYTRE
ncbi:hypothetical protein Tco_0770376 [Tanacetum coccineum]|uniref:Uncharacterized protein n=1 Tax=Tanacetum coccineum TaxID=301880 RepID=A0ABQ4ZD40_9ASTR